MAEYNYEAIKKIVQSNGALGDATGAAPIDQALLQALGAPQAVTIDLGALQDEVLALKFEAESDQTIESKSSIKTTQEDATKIIKVDQEGFNVSDIGTGTSFLGGERVVINANNDHAMVFGEKGVALASPGRVNIDAGQSITLFGNEAVYLGLPNRAIPFDPKTTTQKPKPQSVGDSTNDTEYEPMVLGLKLVNLIEDLIVSLENAVIAAPTGNGVFQPSTLAELELVKVRLPEILSNYGFIDGISHDQIDEDLLKTVKKAKAAAKDFVPPRQLTGMTSGVPLDTLGLGNQPNPNPVTSPYAELPGFYETPSNDPFGDSGTL